MKSDNLALTIVAIVLFPFVCFFILGFAGFFVSEGWYTREDLTAGQQKEIAYALGYDLGPDETLSINYYVGFWPGTIEWMWGEITSIPLKEDFLARCHEKTEFDWEYDYAYFDAYGGSDKLKKAERMINNRWEPWVLQFFFWSVVAAEAVLIVKLIIKLIQRRKQKKEKLHAG